MTHSELVLSRLARLEQRFDGPIPAPLRAWALSGAPAVSRQPEPADALRRRSAALFEQAKRQLREAARNRIHADWSVNRSQLDFHDQRRKLLRAEARRYLTQWADARAAERGAVFELAAE